MRLFILSIGTLVLLGTSLTLAEDRRIDGNVKAVNAGNSSITVTTRAAGKEQDETFDVLKKAKVTVNGQTAELKAMRKGQTATLTFNSELEVVTKIDAPGAALPEPELTALKELPPNAFHSAPWLSSDGLTLYFVTFLPNDKQGWIWTGRRKSQDSLFEDFKRLVPGNDPSVTGDGLEMILLDANALHSATRKSAEESFSRPRKIQEFDGVGHLAGPSLSSDGLTLYSDHWRPGIQDFGKEPVELVRFVRTTRTSKWGPLEVVKFADVPAAAHGNMRFLYVTADQRRAFTMLRGADPTKNRVLVFSRESTVAPFGSPVIVSVDGARRFGSFPRYVATTRELFCMRLNEADKLEIAVIRNFDVDTSTVPLFADDSEDSETGRRTTTRTGENSVTSLEGTWLATAEEANGRKIPMNEVTKKNKTFTVTNRDFMLTYSDGRKYTGRVDFNTDQSPSTIDIHTKETGSGKPLLLRGIFEIDGETLRICWVYEINGETIDRPAAFETADGDKHIFTTFARQSTAKKK